jgi:hypothetical protein
MLGLFDLRSEFTAHSLSSFVHLLTPLFSLYQETGCNFTSVIRNGQMLGVADRRNGKTLSLGWFQPKQQAASEDSGEGQDACTTRVALHCSSVPPSCRITAGRSGLFSQPDSAAGVCADSASPSGQPAEDPFEPKSDRDAARAAAAVGVLGGQPTGTLQLLGDVKLREFFNDGGKVTDLSWLQPDVCTTSCVRRTLYCGVEHHAMIRHEHAGGLLTTLLHSCKHGQLPAASVVKPMK